MNFDKAILLTGIKRPEAPIESTIASAIRGDAKAFATLYDDHAPRVFAICLRMSADRVMAEELVQDVFVRLWERIHGFRFESAFSTWLHRLTVNVVLQRRRTDRRRNARVTLAEDTDSGATGQTLGSFDPGLRLDLEQAIASLPEKLRDVFVLHDIHGRPHDEVAELLGIPVGTSRSHLFRARRALREVLS